MLLSGYIIGIGILLYENNAGALIQGFFNMLLLLICLFPVFALQVIGAGDVKLFLLFGLLSDIRAALFCIILSFFIGALYSLIQMLYYKNLIQRFAYFFQYLKDVLNTNQIQPYHKQQPDKKAVIHFTIPIFLSFCIYWIGGTSWMPF